jgi:hypothetical protein
MDAIFQPGQLVRVNLAGLDAGGVTFQAAVTDAVGHILKQTSEQPPKYLVELLFSFRGVSQVKVPADRIHAQVTTGKMGERSSCRCQRPSRKRYRHQAPSAWNLNPIAAVPVPSAFPASS